jgi:hypothetical protein
MESDEQLHTFRQLIAQFSGDRIEAKYPEEDLISGLSASTASMLILGNLITKTTGLDTKAAEVEALFGKRG